MKILDRYVLFTFLKNYVLSFMILVGLYIILDMLFNFDDLMAVSNKEGQGVSVPKLLLTIFDYYFYQMFQIFVTLAGVIPVVAAAFTLMRMSRFNELSAMLSAGVQLLRITLPIVISTVILQGLVLADQELLIPNIMGKLTRKHNEAHMASGNRFAIPSMQDGNGRLLNAGWFYPGARRPWMENVVIIEHDDEFRRVRQINADKATWDEAAGQWQLTGAKLIEGTLPGEKTTVSDYTGSYKGTITPEEIGLYRSGSSSFVNLLSMRQINQLLDRPFSYGANALQRVKHGRVAALLINVVLLLLAIPCVLTREPGKLKQAAMKCLVLVGLCMGSVFLTQMLAGQPPSAALSAQWPMIMAWVPIFIFGPIAVLLMDRVET